MELGPPGPINIVLTDAANPHENPVSPSARAAPGAIGLPQFLR